MGKHWNRNDFKINSRFWEHWGVDGALPFRIRNLSDVCAILRSVGIENALYGTTLRHAWEHKELRSDHDDDIAVGCNYEHLLEMALPKLEEAGFDTIRQGTLVSVARWGRYIDFHPVSVGDIDLKKIHGVALPFSAESSSWLLAAQARIPKKIELKVQLKYFLVRLTRVVKDPLQFVGSKMMSAGRATVSKSRGRRSRILTKNEFLALELEAPSSVNWDWRGMHLRRVGKPGMTLGQILEAATNKEFFENILETPTARTFDEPIALSRDFWQSGDNFFALPLKYGFRHLVMPYSAANLYIRRIGSPLLYSEEYFRTLKAMSEPEIELFLSSRPIEVAGNCLTSGRHRAMAMLGHMLSGGNYVAVRATFS